MDLLNRKVLFIGPQFNNYENKIIAEMQLLGASVEFVPLMHFDSTLYRVLNHVKAIKRIIENKTVLRKVDLFEKIDFDYVFVIRGGLLNKKTIDTIKIKNPNAKFILYLWDSIAENPNVSHILNCFNTIKSFDPVDCRLYNFEYLPLFYTNDFKVSQSERIEYDISFVGTNHADRYKILKKIIDDSVINNYTTHFIIVTSKLAYIKRKILSYKEYKNALMSDFYFSKISLTDVASIYSRSNCVVDIHNDVQSGLTMRVFELLATGNRLVTTNSHIKDLDFYDPSVILVIDRNNPQVDAEFIKSNTKKVLNINNYSLNSWIKNIFR